MLTAHRYTATVLASCPIAKRHSRSSWRLIMCNSRLSALSERSVRRNLEGALEGRVDSEGVRCSQDYRMHSESSYDRRPRGDCARIVENVAYTLRQRVRCYVKELNTMGFGEAAATPPTLVAIFANTEDSASDAYSHATALACQEDGIAFKLSYVERNNVINVVREMNEDAHVTGIQIYYPLFKYLGGKRGPYKNVLHGVYYKTNDDFLRDTVSHRCDVEGLGHAYNNRILYKDPDYIDIPEGEGASKYIFPCTALSVVRILQNCPDCYDIQRPIGKRFQGNIVTVVNRSAIFGRPLAVLLSNDGATVYSIDVNSTVMFQNGRAKRCTNGDSLEGCIRKSSIIVCGVPNSNFRIPLDWMPRNSVIIDVAHGGNVGERIENRDDDVTYIPQIGRVTVAALLHNLISLHRKFVSLSSHAP